MDGPMRRILVTVASAALVTTGSVVALTVTADPAEAVTPPKATTTILCEQASSGKPAGKYDGPSASYPYDRRFSAGPTVSKEELSHHTPQGVTWWDNWNGKGDDLLLISAHDHDSSNSHLIGLDPSNPGKTVGTLSIGKTHAGALGKNGSWLFIDGPKSGKWHTIRTYSLDSVRKAMEAGSGTLKSVGADRLVYGASFLTVDGGKLYAGKFNQTKRDWMYRYSIGSNGSLTLDRKPDGYGLKWEVPSGTQGVAKAGGRFLFSSSKGRAVRSNLYLTNASQTNLDKASVRCLRTPSMSQGVTLAPGGRVLLNFESGSYEFDGRSGARALNVIRGVHSAKLSSLTGFSGGTLRVGTLHSKTQEDWVGDDEIAIKVEDDQLGKTINISEGERKKINTYIQFSGDAEIKIYERDSPDGDDYLGQKTIKPGTKSGILSFEADDAHYRLSYSVK